MVWGKNGTPVTLTGTASQVQITDLAGNKFNQFMRNDIKSSSMTVNTIFNNDTGSLYAYRISYSGGADSTAVSQAKFLESTGNDVGQEFHTMYSCWISGEEKLVIDSGVESNTSSASVAPTRSEFVGKYVPSSLTDTCDRIDGVASTSTLAISSNLSALGSDITLASAIPAIPPLILALQSPSVGGWVELARTTLGSPANDWGVSGLADKRYLMLLYNETGHNGANGNGNIKYNADGGTSYASRLSNNGGTDWAPVNGTFARFMNDTGTGEPQFAVGYVGNLSTKEKLGIIHSVQQNAVGSSSVPEREESIHKWTDTSEPIDQVNIYDNGGNNSDTGSELVVLGWDPTDTHTTNFWEELASVDTGAGEVLDSGIFVAKKYLWFQFDIVVDTFDNTNATIRFNSDQNGNYARRLSQNGMATDNTAVGQTHMTFTYSGGKRVFGNYFVINNSSSEKLAIGHTNAIGTTSNSTSEGAGVAPRRVEVVGKWANTSSQITQIEVLDTAQGDLGLTSGTIKVWGSD